MTEPTIMSLAQIERTKALYDENIIQLDDILELCATVEALYGALAESQKGLQWAAKRLGAVSAITAVLDAPIAHNIALLAQLGRKEAHDA